MDGRICQLRSAIGFSLAQLLPQHILETIANYVGAQSPAIPSLLMTQPLPVRSVYLVPLTFVCRSWRYAANALLYRTAVMIIGETSLRWSEEHMIMLDDIAYTSNICHVKDIYLSIDILEILNTPFKDLTLIKMWRSYGALTMVRSTEIFFEHNDYSTALNNQENPILNGLTSRMLKNIDAFATALRKLMPNVQRLSINRILCKGNADLHSSVIAHIIFDQICPGCNPIGATYSTIDRFPIVGPCNIALQRIVLINTQLEQDAELIRQHSDTLETLTVCGKHYTDAISEILAFDGVSFHITYPQLKHLLLNVSVPAHSPQPPEPRNPIVLDPFPQLMTLIYHGIFPQPSLLAMNENLPHIRHLELIMDSKLVRLSSQNQILGPQSLANIDYLSLTWSLEAFNSVRGEPCTLVSRFIERCSNIRVLRFSRVFHISIGVNGFISHTNFPATLRVLDASIIRLTIHQAVALLCGCPQVQKVSLLLTDLLDNPRHEIPVLAEIHTFQSRHKGNAARTQFLGINFVSFRSPRKAAEFTVLLTDVITSITRVCIIPSTVFSNEVWANIDSALARSPYENNTRLQNVQFELCRRW